MSLEFSPGELVRAWEELHQNIAWKVLLEAVNIQRSVRQDMIMREATTPDNIYEREQIRGEWAGLALVTEYADTLYETAQQDLSVILKESENVDQKV
jgi:hypothetical protein